MTDNARYNAMCRLAWFLIGGQEIYADQDESVKKALRERARIILGFKPVK